MTLTYKIGKTLAKFLLAVIFRVQIAGTRKLPEGPVIVVSNHISNWDVLILGGVFDRQIHYMAKKELFKNPLLKKLMEALGAFPVDRGGADVNAIRKSLEILSSADGGVVGIFPQGTRVKDDASFEVAGGVGMIALRSGATIVPVHIEGPYRLFRRMYIDIGEPFKPEKPGGRISKELINEVSAEVGKRVNLLKAARKSAKNA